MKEKVQGFWDGVKALWGGLSRIARIVLLCAVVGVLAAIIVLAILMNRKEYVLLNTDFNRTESAMAMAVLQEQGIDCKIAYNGVIMVLDSDENKARMQLAAAGLPGGVYDSSYSPGLTATESDKKYLQNADLQKRLESIIVTNEEVDMAAVTIAQPERSAFALAVDTVPPSANVSLRMKAGRTLSSEQVQGIVNLVKHSVPGIEDDNISVSDETGNLRTSVDSSIEVNNAKLRLTEEVNSTMRSRAMSMLTKIYGADNVEVQVSSVLDTDTRESKRITYEPLDDEDPTNNPYNYSEYEQELIGDRNTVAGGVPGANDNVGTPEYGEQFAENDDITSFRVHGIYDYLVGSLQEEFSKEGLVITGATAAVIINRPDLAEGQRDQIMTMVSNATGIAVESVSVHNFVFDTPEVIPTGTFPEIVEGLSAMQILILALIAVLVLVILIVTIIIIVTKRRKDAEEDQDELEGVEYDENGMPLFDLMDQDEEFEPITLMETNEQKLRAQIKDLADSDPEIVASLLKNWLSSTT